MVVGGAVVVGDVVGVDTVVDEPPVLICTTRRGAFAVSRLSNDTACVDGSTSARSTTPPLAAAAVTSMSTHEPATIGPELATRAPGDGALAKVTELSSHGAETPCASTPEGRLLTACSESVACVTPATEVGRTKRRYETIDGFPSTRSFTSFPSFELGLVDDTYASPAAVNEAVESGPLELATATPRTNRTRIKIPCR